jgi:ribosomal protein L37E
MSGDTYMKNKTQKSIISILIVVLLVSPVFVMPAMAVNNGINWDFEFYDEGAEADVHININTTGTGSNLVFQLSLALDGVLTTSVSVPGVDFGSGTFDSYVSIGSYTIFVPLQGNEMGKNGEPKIVSGIGEGHNWKEVGRSNPTCTEDGYISYLCSTHSDRYTEVLGMLGHDWNEGKVTTVTTCEGDGVMTFTCRRCGETYTEVIDAIGHDWIANIVAPTCTEKGYTEHICINDATHNYNDAEVDANGHAHLRVVTTSASCEKTGVATFTCPICGDVYTEVIPAIGHDYVAGTPVAPTCTAQGYTVYTCTNNPEHNYKDDFEDALGHKWDKGVVTKNPTFDEEGERTYTCERCGITKTETIKKLVWDEVGKDDVYGTKIASSAQYNYAGDLVEFWWGYKGASGLQCKDGLLIVNEAFFESYGGLTIFIKSSASIQYLKADVTVSGDYEIAVPKWADADGKVHNINMVWIGFIDKIPESE